MTNDTRQTMNGRQSAVNIYVVGRKSFVVSRGFTLPEILVAMVLFLLLMGSVSGLILSAISAQRRALAVQELVSQTSYLSEYMSRHIRQARKETGQGCLLQQGTNYEVTRGGRGLKFVNGQNQCQEFFLDEGRIQETRGSQTLFLVPEDTNVAAFNFSVSGAADTDALQPKVSLFMTLETKGRRAESMVALPLHTTISQRNFDVE